MKHWLQVNPIDCWSRFISLLHRQWFAVFGNVMEWYDLGLYGYFALTFAHLFFPAAHHSLGVLFAFFTYAIGIIIRPLGGVLFGHLGDTRGHIKGLRLAVNFIALPTFCIGLLPSFQQVGLWAPVALIVLRCAQGLCAGGQYVGLMTVLSERSGDNERALGCSIACVTSFCGYILAVAVCYLVVHSMSHAAFLGWGWRIPFLLALAFFVFNCCWDKHWRAAAQKSPAEFVSNQQHAAAQDVAGRSPLAVLWRNYRWQLLLSTLLSAVMGALYSSVFVYMYSFMRQFGQLAISQALLINGFALVLSCVLIPWFAAYADRYGRRLVLKIGFYWLLFISWPAIFCIVQASLSIVLLGLALVVVGVTLLIAASAVVYCELFPSSVRYSGSAVSYNVGMALLGSTSPLLIQAGIMWHGNVYSFAVYLIMLALSGLVISWMLPETAPGVT